MTDARCPACNSDGRSELCAVCVSAFIEKQKAVQAGINQKLDSLSQMTGWTSWKFWDNNATIVVFDRYGREISRTGGSDAQHGSNELSDKPSPKYRVPRFKIKRKRAGKTG